MKFIHLLLILSPPNNYNNMKQTLIGLSFAALLLSSCGSSEVKEVEVMEEETVLVDSVAVEMHQATQEIEETSAEVDQILNEL